MESGIVVALIASGAALVGTMANLVIAFKRGNADSAQARLASAIRRGEEKVRVLRAQNVAAEKLRTACWHLLAAAKMREAARPGSATTFPVAMQGFQEAYREFFDSWAETKNEVPAEDLEYVRRLRHVCRRTAHGVSATLAQLAAPGSESGSAALPRTLQRRLDELLAQLDRLFTAMADIKIREIQRLLLKE